MRKKLLILFGVLLLFSSCEEASKFKVTIYANKHGTFCEYLVDSAKMVGNRYVFKYKDRHCNYPQQTEETTNWVTPASGTNTHVEVRSPLEEQLTKQTEERKIMLSCFMSLGCGVTLIFILRSLKKIL